MEITLLSTLPINSVNENSRSGIIWWLSAAAPRVLSLIVNRTPLSIRIACGWSLVVLPWVIVPSNLEYIELACGKYQRI